MRIIIFVKWPYLILALQTQQPSLGRTALELLGATQMAQPKAVLTLLLNDIGRLDPLDAEVPIQAAIMLVLDDYHLITENAIHDALAFFIEHLPPALRLVMVTRADPPLPLARWRAGRKLTEIRADDLRFSAGEASAFLQQEMVLSLSEAQVAMLMTRTEGWVAGLQMAALALQNRHTASTFLSEFRGSNRYVMDYLLEEVLAHLPKTVEKFLLETSILSRLSASLCAAVTGEIDAQSTLRFIEKSNLFLIALDDQRIWYRYHHLFQDVLHNRLLQSAATSLAELHRRASRWHEEQGFVETAIHHALAAGEHTRAATLVEEHAMPLLQSEEVAVVRSWLNALPDEIIEARLPLLLAKGVVLSLTGALDTAVDFFEAHTPRFAAPDAPRPLYGAWLQMRALHARFSNDPASTLAYAEEALENLPPAFNSSRALALTNRGIAQAYLGNIDAAYASFRQAEAEGKVSPTVTVLGALVGLGWLQTQQGELTQAQETYTRVVREAKDLPGRSAPLVGMAWAGLGGILYERNERGAAHVAIAQGIKLLQGSIEQTFLAGAYGTLAFLQQAEGNIAGALATLHQAESWLTQRQLTDLDYRRALRAYRAHLWMDAGRLNDALQWGETIRKPGKFDSVSARSRDQFTLARLWVASGNGEAALTLINDAIAQARAHNHRDNLVKLYAVVALAHQQQGDNEAAQGALSHALTFAAPQRYVRTFLDHGEAMRDLLDAVRPTLDDPFLQAYVDQLLINFAPADPMPDAAAEIETVRTSLVDEQQGNQSLVEPLSDRELEILRLVTQGLSNREIASHIIVTVGTVKRHLNNIYGKLGVSSRTQAIARTRELQLI